MLTHTPHVKRASRSQLQQVSGWAQECCVLQWFLKVLLQKGFIAPRRPQEAPKRPLRGPKRPQEGPQGLPSSHMLAHAHTCPHSVAHLPTCSNLVTHVMACLHMLRHVHTLNALAYNLFTHAHTCSHMPARPLADMYSRVRTCSHVFTHVHTCSRVFTHAHTCAHMLTHAHTHSTCKRASRSQLQQVSGWAQECCVLQWFLKVWLQNDCGIGSFICVL